MNDHEMEQRLRGWYGAEIDQGDAAPSVLRAAVMAIPTEASRSWLRGRRPTLLLVAAISAVGIAGALAIGSDLLPKPDVAPKPSNGFAIMPSTSPQPSPAEPTTGPAFEQGFRSIGSMAVPRFQHTATLLADGRVLIVGGTSLEQRHLSTTEIWDPTTERITIGQPLRVGRFGHGATLLADGSVLIVGGVVAGDPEERGTREIELWDPATGIFRAAGRTTLPHTSSLSTVLLADGRVLIIGGVNCGSLRDAPPSEREARLICMQQQLMTETWDPVTESVTAAGFLKEDHDWASATLLDDGRVFVLGGGGLPTIGAEVWDPATRAWSRGGRPGNDRLGGQTATLLPDGRVLVVGGQTGTLNGDTFQPPLSSAEIWHPATSSFSPAGSMQLGRERHTATILADGRVLVVGGVGAPAADFSDTSIAQAEVWDPATGSFTDAGLAATGRTLHTATRLQDGRVLITGGFVRTDRGEPIEDTASAETWAP